MTCEILLSNGMYVVVDDQDYDRVREYTWTAQKGRRTWYAVSGTGAGRGGKQVSMHRLILDAQPGQEVDHVDCDGLNNRRDNLRLCTRMQQRANQLKQDGTYSSVYKGVTWFKRDNRWKAQIMRNGINYHLGYYDDELDAALAYDIAAKEAFGEFARTNF